MNALDPAVTLAMVKAARAVLDDIQAEAEQALLATHGPGDRKHARIDGADCGTIAITQPRETLRVVNDSAFTAWCEEHHPDAIERTVRKSDQRAILAKALTKAKSDGELPPGVAPADPGAPQVRTTMTDAQGEALAEAFRTGTLSLARLLEVES